MESMKPKNQQSLIIKAITWHKDSHSLFDYEANKVQPKIFSFPTTTKSVTFYRMRQCKNQKINVASAIIAVNDGMDSSKIDLQQYQLLTHFQIRPHPSANKLRLDFNDFSKSSLKMKKINSDRLNTDESISSSSNKEEQTYLIVRKIKDINSQQKGYKLVPGQIIKLGRVEYFVSEVKEGNNRIFADNKCKNTPSTSNRKVMTFNSIQEEAKEKGPCKICLEEIGTSDNFLFNPCKCSGSCGTVHVDCLVQWINFKVKKQVIGGTLHFNFSKFQCEVCKSELPMIIDVDGKQRQLLPIEKPEDNYLILEGACEKTKSVMVLQNVPSTGIKLGRGHQCEIRITDISVSRTHAHIKNVGNSFYLFDNKSKFGTIVKDENMSLQIGRLSRGVQIGRTTLNFQIKKQSNSNSNQEIKTEDRTRPRLE